MPYRHAVWALALLAPLILLAFWPGYFGTLNTAPFAFHAHGVTAVVWLGLVAFQSASAHWRSRAMHRAAGRVLFVAVPLFVVGGVLVMHSMATKFALGEYPFYSVLGARLGMHDVVSTTPMVGLVALALLNRRKAALHGGYMLATVLLVLPPVVARLPIPSFFHSGELIAIALALLALWREPRGHVAFLVVIAIQILQILLFETVSASPQWEAAFADFSRLSPWPFALSCAGISFAVLVAAWRAVPGPRPVSA
ncbi:MAG: hypothetical protein K2X61_04300 [Caulobacteraceae bacterium]|nr:hypothetical protein [Caulobacteraceae bacterium]